MNANNNGPRSDAWNVDLVDPVIVTHQGKTVLIAREKVVACDTLYYNVFDPSEAINQLDDFAWNGWYRFNFNTGTTAQATNVNYDELQTAPELRLAGMDLLTVPYTVQSVSTADATFKAYSDGTHIVTFRQSNQNTLYMNRLMLTDYSVEIEGKAETRFAIENAWEVRFKYSGLKDVAGSDVDTQSYMNSINQPFIEPTLELEAVKNVQNGLFSVIEVPTADSNTKVIYIAVNSGTHAQLYQIQKSSDGLVDFSDSNIQYEPIIPILTTGSAPLVPLAGLAPALAFYAEQEPTSAADSSQAELQRLGRVVLAIPVSGGGLQKAMAIFDYSLDSNGNISNIPSAKQTAPLVDGVLTGGVFTPDTTSESYPTPQNIAETLKLIDKLIVNTMILGQIEAHQSPNLYMGDDGLLHLYYGGPLPTSISGFWSSLDPNLPQAMVAQYETRVNHLVIKASWKQLQDTEQPAGNVLFNGLLSGVAMEGATVEISDTTFNSAAPADLCDIAITYPSALNLPNETWVGVPRNVIALASILNGEATDGPSDPNAKSSIRQFFDFGSKKGIVRISLSSKSAPTEPTDSVLQFISSLDDIELTNIDVTTSNSNLNYACTFTTDTGTSINITWDNVPTNFMLYADIFSGVAGSNSYAYPTNSNNTSLWTLNTSSIQIDTPLIFYPKDCTVPATLTIGVSQETNTNTLKVEFNPSGMPVIIDNVPPGVADFTTYLMANSAFQALKLGIASHGASGNVLLTEENQSAIGLEETSVLFDLLLPDHTLDTLQTKIDNYPAGKQSHTFSPTTTLSNTKLAGFYVSLDLPDGQLPAYVQNIDSSSIMASRSVLGVNAPQLHSALWVRQEPQKGCTFNGSNSVVVPVASNGTALPQSINLQPRWEWTLEAWVKPVGSQQQQLIRFSDNLTPVANGAPSLDYAIGMKGQQVFELSSFTPTPGKLESTYLKTGVSPQASFYPNTEFTWEFWVQPDVVAGPTSSGTNTAPLGGIFQIGVNDTAPTFALGFTADRHLCIETLDSLNQPHKYTTTLAIPAEDTNNLPIWTHLALVGNIDTNETWTISVIMNGVELQIFTGVDFATTGSPTLIIGGNSIIIETAPVINTSIFGQLSQLRYWGIARTIAEIRRTWLTSLIGSEFGLLGMWPMGILSTNSSGKNIFENKAYITGHLWDALLIPSTSQPTNMVDDSFFLSVLASVGGLPAIEAPALAINGNWNHLAIVYEAGGALDMNPDSRFNSGLYDWMEVEESESLTPNTEFAIDAWVIVPTTLNIPATIMAKWGLPNANTDENSFRFWVDRDGSLNFDVVYVSSLFGDTTLKTFKSTSFNLKDDQPHHIAACFSSTPSIPNSESDPTPATFTLSLFVDGVAETTSAITVAEVSSVRVQTTQTNLLLGRDFLEVKGSQPIAIENISFFRGTIGQVQFWNISPDIQQLFPEEYPRLPHIGVAKGIAAQWNFREQKGRVAKDAVGGNDGILSSSAMWSSLSATSGFKVYSNGALVGSSIPFTGNFSAGATNQLCFGQPSSSVIGFSGEMAQISLYDKARGMEEIQAQQFVPRDGSEQGLIACWNFSDGGTDITGGQNNANPAIADNRLVTSDAPMSNEGPYVQNVYGGLTTELSQSAPGFIAVGNYFDIMDPGTLKQQAVLKRQFVMDPSQTFTRAIQIGELDLTFIGQVQTEPTLIGYIEGAPPVPSENLTRPYYLSPGGSPYMKYLDTSTVSLIQESSDSVSFSSVSNSATQIDLSGAFGIIGMKDSGDISTGTPFISIESDLYTVKNVLQLKAKFSATIGTINGLAFNSNWGDKQTDMMGLSGDWENEPYLNPTVGRRFIADNLGYAMVESLTGDLYSVVFKATKASLGTIVIPNLNIPPDRNIILFPIKNEDYTKSTTLDGKIGLMNDPDFLDADAQRGSYYKPIEAYATQNEIEYKQQRALSYAAQFDAVGQGRAGDDDLDQVKENLASKVEKDPENNNLNRLIPSQGIVNKFVWTADGGIYSDQQNFGATASRSFTGFRKVDGGAGVGGDGEFFAKLGFAWSFDIMATHSTQIEVGKEDEVSQNITLDVNVEGEAFLKAWNPTINNNNGEYNSQAAAGKVKAYRFSSFYLPPDMKNSNGFKGIVDPNWLKYSSDPMARAVREIDLSNPTWRVFHRTTYIQRIPPSAASSPSYAPLSNNKTPVNLMGNIQLCQLTKTELGRIGNTISRLTVGAAVASVMNPTATSPGVYPPASLEAIVPWWTDFLNSARPDVNGTIQNPANGKILNDMFSTVISYMYDGFVTNSIQQLLGSSAK